MSSVSKIRTFLRIVSDKGLQQAVETSTEYAIWNLKAEIFDITVSDDIIDRRSEKILVESESAEEVHYTGIHDTVPDSFSNHEGSITTDEKYCRKLTDAHIIGPDGVVECEGGLILPSTVGWSQKNKMFKRRFAREHQLRTWFLNRFKQRKIVGPCFLLSSRIRGINNFALWFYETLPKLYWYERYEASTGDDSLLVTPKLKDYQKETLEYMGYSSDDYYELEDEILKPSSVVLPPQPGLGPRGPWNTSSRSIDWVREQLTRDIEPGNFPERIYISRDDASWRSVSNESEVVDLLEEYGFEKFILSDLSITEQMELFSGADMVVGPHGAGNGHMVYAKESTWIEIFPGKEAAKPFYFVLAHRLGHNYEYIIAEPEGFQHPEKTAPRHQDVSVDITQLARTLEKTRDRVV